MSRVSNKKGLLVLLVCFAALLLVWLDRQNIYDWWRLRGYTPPAQVVQLADQTSMTPYARHLFYVYHPALEASSPFNQHCSNTPGQAVVLGCTAIRQGIYLYNVTDPTLDGELQVTAAYEMLHVGYDRLSPSKRQHIDQLVMAQFETSSATDPRLKDEEQSYLKTEGQGAVANELHSMMGTEVATLSPELESYYSQYFSNRQTIINYKNQYQGVFTQRQTQVAQDDAQLATMKAQIDNLNTTLGAQENSLSAQRAQLNSLLANKQYDDYNAQVPGFNAAIADYNSDVDSQQQLINQYNSLLDSRNAIALQEQQLVKALDSHATAQPIQ